MTNSQQTELMAMLDSKIIPLAKISVPVDDRAFLYGESLFTTIRCTGGLPVLLERHCQRLNNSLQNPVVGFPSGFEIDTEQLRADIHTLLAYNKCEEAVARFMISRGSGPGPIAPADCQPRTLLTVKPYHPNRELYKRGARLHISSIKRHLSDMLAQHKLGSYFPCLAARREAVANGFDEGVITDTDGRLLECACSNLFVVSENDELVTPDIAAPILLGVMREAVLEAAEKLGIKICLTFIGENELSTAKEMFITNSLTGIVPVSCCGKKRFSDLAGEYTSQLAKSVEKLAPHE